MSTHIVSTHEAKSRVSELIRKAEQGTEVIVARNGRPVAKIVPWTPTKSTRSPGSWAGSVSYQGDIVASDEEVVEVFNDSIDAELL